MGDEEIKTITLFKDRPIYDAVFDKNKRKTMRKKIKKKSATRSLISNIFAFDKHEEASPEVFDDFYKSGDSSSDTKLKALREVFDETGNLISALHTFKSLENEIYKNMLPPLEVLSEEKKIQMLKKLKDLNFLSNKNIAA